eukprot:CCRYP_013163-RB/>CCRYP_013163-RB protein AED:0.49 eAED:1.00 QI:0/0/0/1/0/0/2/0/95
MLRYKKNYGGRLDSKDIDHHHRLECRQNNVDFLWLTYGSLTLTTITKPVGNSTGKHFYYYTIDIHALGTLGSEHHTFNIHLNFVGVNVENLSDGI